MADLNTFDDQVVVFEAVKTSGTSRLPVREPLRPTNTQILSPPRKEYHSHGMDGVADVKLSVPHSQGPGLNARNEENPPNPSSHPISPGTFGPPRISDRSRETLSPAVPSHENGMLLPSSRPSPPTLTKSAGYQSYQPPASRQNTDGSRLTGYPAQQSRSAEEQAISPQRQQAHIAQRAQSGQASVTSRFSSNESNGLHSPSQDSPMPGATSKASVGTDEAIGYNHFCKSMRGRLPTTRPGMTNGKQ